MSDLKCWGNMIIEKIISGGQTGTNIAGIDAAIAAGFPYGGWIPQGRRTEAGHWKTNIYYNK